MQRGAVVLLEGQPVKTSLVIRIGSVWGDQA